MVRNSQKYKKVLGIFLAAAMLVGSMAGCGKDTKGIVDPAKGTKLQENSNGSGGGKGRFIESEVALPERFSRISAMTKLDNGDLELLGTCEVDTGNAYYLYTSSDMGESWEGIPVKDSLETYQASAAIRGDGTVAQILQDIDRETEEWQSWLQVVSPEGEATQKKIVYAPDTKDTDTLNIVMTGAAFDGMGQLFVQNIAGNIYRVDMETGELELYCDLEEENTNFFDIAGNLIMAVTASGVWLADTNSGSPLEADTVLDDMINADKTLSEATGNAARSLVFAEGIGEDTIVYLNHDGIFYHTRGGSVSELLVNGSINSIGDVSSSFIALAMMDEEHFMVQSMTADGSYKLLKYSYDKNASAMPETELSVYALQDSTLLRQMIAAYQKKNQNVYVNLTIGLSGTDGMTTEDALRALNTDILAGNGPDVLILDGMPVESYIEKGILADMSGLVQELKDGDGVFENIMDTYEQDGAIYEIPNRFYFSIVDGTKEGVAAGASLEKLADYGEYLKNSGEKGIFAYTTKVSLLERLYEMDEANWWDADGRLKEAAISDWLTQAKRIYDVDAREDTDVTGFNGYDLDNILVGSADAFGILMGESKVTMGSIINMNDLMTIKASNEQMDGDYALAGTDIARVFIPYMRVGIVQGMPDQETAKDFVGTMLGTECQSIDGSGFPISRAGFDAIAMKAENQYGDFNMGGIMVSNEEGVTMSLELHNLTQEDVEKLTGIMESLDKSANMDGVVREIVLEQAVEFLEGNQTKEDTVSTILQKCNLYLSE